MRPSANDGGRVAWENSFVILTVAHPLLSFRTPRSGDPESITTIWGYGFRARSLTLAPRNDGGDSANASLSRVFIFRAFGPARLPVFRFPSNEGNGAPGGAGRF